MSSLINTCLPNNIYKPVERTLFLGSSIQSFDVQCGWGQESSQLSVVLVDDPCGGSKIYYDANLQKQTWTDPDPGFLGISNSIIGCPVYFRVSDFEVSMLVQSWEKMNSISGNPTYRVNLISPTQILEGAKLILSEYSGGVGTAYNIFNLYGFLEQFGNSCPQTYLKTLSSGEGPDPSGYLPGNLGPDGAMFGSENGGFGGAYVNGNGIQWNRIKTALNILVGAIPSVNNVYSPYGRLMFYGCDISGYGLCGYDRAEFLSPFTGHSGYYSDYILDLSELPNPGDYFRISGSNISILDAINQICDICSYDYYIELLMVNDITKIIAPSGIIKIIKIRAVSREIQPILGSIQSFINNSEGCISTNVGKELRSENTTSFLIGGNKQSIYQIESSDDPEDDGDPDIEHYPKEADDIILPYFGKDIDEDVLIPQKDSNGKWFFYAPLDNINKKLQYIKPLVSPSPDPYKDYDSIKITENELLAALGGYDEWLSYTMTPRIIYDPILGMVKPAPAPNIMTDLGQAIEDTGKIPNGISGPFGGGNIVNLMNIWLNNLKPAGRDIVNPRAHKETLGDILDTIQKQQTEDLQAIYEWVHTYAATYYGLQFQVRIPYTCIRRDDTSNAILTSEECSDGGWTDQKSVIKLDNVPLGPIQRFMTTDNRLGGFVRYDYELTYSMRQGLSQLNESDYILKETAPGSNSYMLWIKSEAEKDFVYLDKQTYLSPRAIIKVPMPIRKTVLDSIENCNLLVELMNKATEAVPDAQKNIINNGLNDLIRGGVQAAWTAVSMEYEYVIPNAVAIPIKSNTNTYGPWVSLGPAGSARIDHDPGLVPWEYNGMDNLDIAANELVTNGLSLSQIEEMGEVVIPGYPSIPLAAEIGSVAGGYYSGGSNLIENRIISSGNFSENNFTGSPINYTYAYFNFGSAWVGNYGPHITNINTQVNKDGVQTRYQFRTFTKKFGNMQKTNAERLKQIGKNKIEYRRNLNKIIDDKSKRLEWYGPSVGNVRVIRDQKGSQITHKTPHDILVGQLLNWSAYNLTGDIEPVDESSSSSDSNIFSNSNSSSDEVDTRCKRTIVYSEDLLDLQRDLAIDYSKKAFMSFDGLIRPISMDGDGGLPRYANTTSSCQKTQSIGAQPPIFLSGDAISESDSIIEVDPKDYIDSDSSSEEQNNISTFSLEYDLQIDVDYLNPLSNPSGYARSKIADRVNLYYGHDFDIVGRGDDDESGTLSLPVEKNSGDYFDDYRFLGLRGPLIVNGWGYDTDGFPVPNSADNYEDAKQGIFTESGLTHNFMNNWLKKPEAWVTAPVDLRFDRKRGVWISPPSFRLVQATLLGDLDAYGSQWASLESIPDDGLWDSKGNEIEEPLIVVIDKLGCSLLSGANVIAYYHPEKCEYWILNSCGGGEESSSSGSSSESSSILSSSESSSISSSSESSSVPSSSESESSSIPSSSESESSIPSSSESESIPSESDKSSAIVPASWTPGGYTALFIVESPEVRFEDIQIVEVNEKTTIVEIDPKFVEVCENNTLEICGCVPDEPVSVGAKAYNGFITIKLSRKRKTPVRLVLKLNGVRKGFLGKRLPNRTRKQFIANEKFLRTAYPGGN